MGEKDSDKGLLFCYLFWHLRDAKLNKLAFFLKIMPFFISVYQWQRNKQVCLFKLVSKLIEKLKIRTYKRLN